MALTTAEAVIYELARHAGLTVNAMSVGILTVLVFGAGTDYALLLVARYREELRRHEDRHQAMQVALRRASPAIIASASTVILGLLCLTFAETNSTSGLGPVAAIGVAVALVTMLTLLPALLVTVGRWIFWPVHPTLRIGRADGAGPLGPYGKPHRPPPPAGVDRHGARSGRAGPGGDRLPRQRAHQQPVVPGAPERGRRPGRPRRATSRPVWAVRSSSSPTPESVTPVQRAFAATPGIAAVAPPVTGDGKVYLQGTLSPPPDSQAAYRVVDQLRTEVHADRRSRRQGRRRHGDQPRRRTSRRP